MGIIRLMPRPQNITIQGQLVLQLRSQLNLTQQELAQRVYKILDRSSHIPTRDTLERRCRDWESENHISRQMLPALAIALNVSVEYLRQGGAPDPTEDRTAEIANRLREQIVAGAFPAIQFVASVRELGEMGAIPPLVDDDAAYWQAARAIEVRLGAAQLNANRAEVNTLGNILSWAASDFRKPATAHPYWLLLVNCAVGERMHLKRGTPTAELLIIRTIEAWCEDFYGECRASLSEDGPWLRIRLEEGDDGQFDQTISVARCESIEAGLNYTKPTDLDRDELMAALMPILRCNFKHVDRLKLPSSWPDPIDDFVGPFQPLWAQERMGRYLPSENSFSKESNDGPHSER